MKNKIIKITILLISIFPVFIMPILGMDFKTYIIFSVILAALTILTIWRQKDLFSTVLFFTLIHITRPINFKFCDLIDFNFPGTFNLIPIIIFTIFIITFPKINKSIGWWKIDNIDKKSKLIIIGLALISGIALYIWGNFIADDLSYFIKYLPNVPIIWIVINGLSFALFNAIAEEYLARGMLWNGLEKIFSNKWTIIIIQSVVFSIFHYYGFPGGLTGMIMVFSWSIVLGIIRYRTKGLIGVLIGHFLADLTIYFILYGLK